MRDVAESERGAHARPTHPLTNPRHNTAASGYSYMCGKGCSNAGVTCTWEYISTVEAALKCSLDPECRGFQAGDEDNGFHGQWIRISVSALPEQVTESHGCHATLAGQQLTFRKCTPSDYIEGSDFWPRGDNEPRPGLVEGRQCEHVYWERVRRHRCI